MRLDSKSACIVDAVEILSMYIARKPLKVKKGLSCSWVEAYIYFAGAGPVSPHLDEASHDDSANTSKQSLLARMSWCCVSCSSSKTV